MRHVDQSTLHNPAIAFCTFIAVDLSSYSVIEYYKLRKRCVSKRTDELIPLCHSLGLDSARVEFSFPDHERLRIEVEIRTSGRTGVEMEALTAVSVAALTMYDMAKAVDRGMRIENVKLLSKRGGRSGDFVADDA